ncbi:MAG: peptidoglycan DD-metalloendopeptidase family protein [Deltaproteobacteria bacterium]|nr:MAG: peptidoglycan DD-metalloendopeptidase family protein [Deltaproteobacteria bacterium]
MIGVLTAFLIMLWFPVAALSVETDRSVEHSIRTHQEQMGEVQEQIEQSRAQIEAMRQQERLILDRLDKMELQLQHYQEEILSLKRERASLQKEIVEKRKRLEQLTNEMEKLRYLLEHRLEALYKFGQQAYLNLLVSAQDVSVLQHNWVYLRAVVEQDSTLIRQFRDKQTEEEKLTLALRSREQRLGELLTDIKQKKAEKQKVKREQVTLLQDVHNQEEMYRRYVTELEAVSRELRSIVEGLQRQTTTEKNTGLPKEDIASKKGALPYPVQGRVVSQFGPRQHEKFGTTIRNNGIEITTRNLAPVVAVYTGQVLYSAWVRGYGKVIIIDHGDKYYTLTGHLAEVSKPAGNMVEAGEIIGYAGSSPVDTEGGRVYFEIRHQGKALNPKTWLLPALASTDVPAKK